MACQASLTASFMNWYGTNQCGQTLPFYGTYVFWRPKFLIFTPGMVLWLWEWYCDYGDELHAECRWSDISLNHWCHYGLAVLQDNTNLTKSLVVCKCKLWVAWVPPSAGNQSLMHGIDSRKPYNCYFISLRWVLPRYIISDMHKTYDSRRIHICSART